MVLGIFPVSAMTALLSEETPVFTASNPEYLRALLTEGDAVVATSGNLGIFSHHSQFVIPAGRTLIVRTTLNIQDAAELVIKGTLIVEEGGRVNNQGGVGGTITIAPGGTLVNNGHVENVTNSTITNAGTIVNNARFEIRANTAFCDCNGFLAGTTPLNIHRYAISCRCLDENGVIFTDVIGVARASDIYTPIVSSNEFNYTLNTLSIVVDGNSASIRTEVGGVQVEFNPTLQQSRLGFNSANQLFGVDNVPSGDFQLISFLIEQNADSFNLITPNLNFIGNTVVTIVLYNRLEKVNE